MIPITVTLIICLTLLAINYQGVSITHTQKKEETYQDKTNYPNVSTDEFEIKEKLGKQKTEEDDVVENTMSQINEYFPEEGNNG